jgi:hypothetical protein
MEALSMDDTQAALVAEQVKHALDLFKADLDAIRSMADHRQELSDHRLKALEENARDHETRIRLATDGVVQFKVWSGLASGGSSILAVISLIKAFFGGG